MFGDDFALPDDPSDRGRGTGSNREEISARV
jgi:hypothetical protein